MATSREIENRNFLSPTGFKFVLKRAPKVAFFCNQANIPDLNLGVIEQTNYLRPIPVPGDKIEFGDLRLTFMVDEDLGNFMEIFNWIRGLGYAQSMDEFNDLANAGLISPNYVQKGDNIYSDGTLQILNSSSITNFQIFFSDLFPYNLSTMSFDATQTDIQYFTAEVSFKYSIFNITDLSGNPL